ncbi:helix-turn-helix domain-containing protein [Paenibacillus sp. 1001270B_150601_E10]|uniref:helix-turn-helix domain-containing protein n=1 Tax=Paenibacillus sp. 1001270B_150601_E10 TaxID=2787079 RepID=UPI00189ECB10|nr:helix-turn-helix domain-containing protein [Paenibacillus sp. 1001270B_150601_E10]
MGFNEKLVQLRKERGMTQESLADLLKVSRQAISKWESGQSYPEMDKLIALSELYGVTLDSLVKDQDVQKDSHNTISEPYWMSRGHYYEYKSQITWFGLPLIHVHIGRGFKKAKGIIAVGNIATGILSVGLVANGLISLGLISIGLIGIGSISIGLLFSLAAVSIGTFSVGAVAIGIFSLGALSIGMYSVGACAIASHLAIGDYAYAHIAIGRVAKGAIAIIDESPNHDFSLIQANEVRRTIYSIYPNTWKWIVEMMTAIFRN